MNHSNHLLRYARRSFIVCALLLLLPACTVAQPVPTTAPAAPVQNTTAAQALDHNLNDGCVENYDPAVDYFPEKASLEYAVGLNVEYFKHYKVVTVLNPWTGADQTFQYVLLQCGTPAPDGYTEAQMIEVPVQRLVALSTTLLPGLVEMDLLDRLVGVEEFDYINTPAVRAHIESASLVEVGDGGVLNIEVALEQEPDLVMTYAYGSPEWDAHPKLLEAGLITAITADWMETTPLGRAEWLKYTALFFNTEATANDIFTKIAGRYTELAQLAAGVTDRPTVLTNTPWEGTWSISGGNSYFARFLADAGANYLWADDDSTGGIPLDFEAVYERAADADYWLPNTGFWFSQDDVVAEDERYSEFAPFANGQIYNSNARVNEFGGNDYWETGVTNPDLILADLIAIFHPDLLPDHELVFFRHIATGE